MIEENKIQKTLQNIKKSHIIKILKKNFREEKMDRFFDFENEFEFKGSKIQLNKKNSIKINFKTVPIISKYQLPCLYLS